MLSLTHFSLGCATALAIAQPKDMNEAVTFSIVGGLAGLWPDCDLGNSKISKLTNKSIKFLIPLLALCFFTKRQNINIDNIEKLTKFLIGFSTIVGITFLARTRPHREFTHSLLCTLAISVSSWLVGRDLWLCITIGVLSHILIDLLNEKGETLLFPYKKRFSLGLCKSNGLVNNILGAISSLYTLYMLNNVL